MSEKTPIKTASKDILARAMAMEDITVEHRADAPSAYFDVKNRLLCLPVWKEMDNSVYDMLVGHEVSHALHTPADGWSEFVNKNGTRQMFLNVVEDARIERLIKDKFPGLRRDFASAYKTLHEQDLFELAARTIDMDTPLIDRLNLEFKLGLFGLLDVPFATEERQYVTRMAETKTFEEVMELARELYDLHQEQQEQEQEEAGEGGEGTPGAGDADGQGEGSEGESDTESDETGTTGESGEDQQESDQETGAAEGAGSDSGEDSGDSMEDDTDDGESAESTEGDSSSSSSESEMSYEDYEANTGETPSAGSTQRAFEQGMENMRDDSAYSTSYSTLPKMNLEHCVVDWKTISDDLSTWYSKYDENYQNMFTESRGALQSFLNKSKPTVMHMVQQFQMKQAADADKRTDIAKTGVLDTTTMINYRWSEDIFVKNEIHADGKSHGMVMYVDWSGSMSGILQDTVEQLIVLVEFCRKAGIPFDVYAFSSNQFINGQHDRYSDEWNKEIERVEQIQQYEKVTEESLRPHTFQLYQYLSSDMNARQFKAALMNLWWVTQSQHSYRTVPCHYSLGCTPLNEAILCAIQQVPEFQAKHGIQVVNTVVLSDGEGHGIGMRSYHREQSYLRDHSTRKTYEVGSGQGAETNTLVQVLKDKTGCNAISIRLHDAKNIKNLRWSFTDGSESENQRFERACGEYRKQNFTTMPNASYDEYFIVKGNTEVKFDALEELDGDASYTKLKNAFMKGNSNKKSSRVIANRIIDLIAS